MIKPKVKRVNRPEFTQWKVLKWPLKCVSCHGQDFRGVRTNVTSARSVSNTPTIWKLIIGCLIRRVSFRFRVCSSAARVSWIDKLASFAPQFI